jgi:Xaa-Pro aminopeptidase
MVTRRRCRYFSEVTMIDATGRLARLEQQIAQGLEERGIDALVTLSPENVFYTSDIYLVSHRWLPLRLVMTVFHRQGEPTHLICDMHEAFLRAQDGWIKDIRAYVEFVTSPIRLLADVLEEKGLHSNRVWIEKEHLTAAYYEELQATLPDCEFIDCTAFMDRLRMVKTDGEVSLLQENVRLLEQALSETYRATRPGDTERDVAARAICEFAKVGYDALDLLTLTSGKTVHTNFKPGDRRLEAGDMLRIDWVGTRHGYRGDVSRQAVLGEPSHAQVNAYRRFIEAQNYVVDKARVDVRACDLYDLCRREFARVGLAMSLPHIGHGLGVGLHEHPAISPTSEEVLVPGMVFCIEPLGVDPQAGGFAQEVLIHLTEQGPRVLSDYADLDSMYVIEV